MKKIKNLFKTLKALRWAYTMHKVSAHIPVGNFFKTKGEFLKFLSKSMTRKWENIYKIEIDAGSIIIHRTDICRKSRNL
jgi:endonuclease III-like uncharacterized protein